MVKQTKQATKEQTVQKQKPIKQKKQIVKVQAKTNKSERLKIKENKGNSAVIYLGKLPYGWVEEGIKEYFTQFGDVLGVKVKRSKKTNRTQGYGFVKFTDNETAKIAAETMNGYMMFGKQMVAQLLDPKHPDPFKYKHGSEKLRFVNWSHKFIEEKNKNKTEQEVLKELKTLIKNDQKRQKHLEELGIKYTYKGFEDILTQ